MKGYVPPAWVVHIDGGNIRVVIRATTTAVVAAAHDGDEHYDFVAGQN